MTAWETICDGAEKKTLVMIAYRTVEDGKDAGQIVWRIVAPYSVREKEVQKRGGSVQYFYGENGGQIKAFLKDQILDAWQTSVEFEPQWTVELRKQEEEMEEKISEGKLEELEKMALNALPFADTLVCRKFVKEVDEEEEYDFKTWTMIAPEGTWTGAAHNGTLVEEVLDAEALRKLADEYVPDSAFIDRDHESSRGVLERDTKAYGWIKELKAMSGAAPAFNGLYALIDWTPAGEALVKSREYRWMSPTLQIGPDGRPTALVAVALTNRPNFDLPPILNADGKEDDLTETHTMDIEKMKEDVCKMVLDALAEKGKEACGEEPEKAEQTAEEKAETCDACSDEAGDKAGETAEEAAKEEVIKAEALNSAAETQPTVAETVTQTQEWRDLHGEDLMRYYRRQSRVIMA